MNSLVSLFKRERAAMRDTALAVVVATEGSTYCKPGALMLIAGNGDYAGLLSGGCLESDLCEHARGVMSSGEARLLRYDLADAEDPWGLNVGCGGAVKVLLMRVGEQDGWQPCAHLVSHLESHSPTAVALAATNGSPFGLLGSVLLPDTCSEPAVCQALYSTAAANRSGWLGATEKSGLFLLPLSLPPRVLLLGAGPDAVPILEFATRLGWKVTLVDHRPAYAQSLRFPLAERVVAIRPDELCNAIDLADYSAAVVMSHHMPSDLAYLRALADSDLPYLGLLGPAPRTRRLLVELGALGRGLRNRIRAPVGLALGGRGPESIALAIVAEIHAYLHGKIEVQRGRFHRDGHHAVYRIAQE